MAAKDTFRIVFAGGGSGGHVYPMIAVAEALSGHFRELGLQYRLIRMGPRDGYEKLCEQYGITSSPIAAGKIRNYASAANIADLPKFFVGFLQALVKLYFIMPDAIFSKGGTGALPVIVAGWLYRIPVVIHDSDAVPGRTNRASARFAKKIFVSFAAAANFFKKQKVEVVGTPVRTELASARTTKELAKEALGFVPSAPLLLVLGGSQGARRINLFILENLSDIVQMTQVLHQTGLANLAEAERLSHAATIDESFKNRYKAAGYLDENLGLALTAADLAIARAGSGTIFELATFGVPTILVPITKSANNHQRANAYAFASSGGAIVVEEANLLKDLFLGELKSLLGDADRRAKMSAAAKGFATPDAAEKIAIEILANLR